MGLNFNSSKAELRISIRSSVFDLFLLLLFFKNFFSFSRHPDETCEMRTVALVLMCLGLAYSESKNIFHGMGELLVAIRFRV